MERKSSYRVNKIVNDRIFKNIHSDKETVNNFKRVIENIPTILLFFYLVGFVYLKTYYSKFDIPIECYWTVTDMVFIALYKITFVVLLYIIVEILEIFISGMLNFLFKRSLLKYHDLTINSVLVGVMAFAFMTSFITFFHIPGKPFMFILAPYFLYKRITTVENIKLKKYQVLIFGLITTVIALAFFSGKYEADAVKQEKQDRNLELVNGDEKHIIDGNKFSLIGETSSNIFIYDKKKKRSIIYNKADFQQIIIKDIDTIPSPRFEEGSLPIPRKPY